MVKKKKKQSKEERKSTILSRKENNPSRMQLVLTELYAGVQILSKEIASKQNLSPTKLKIRFPFIYANTSLDTKTLGIASNRNF